MAALAPPMAALCGMGLVLAWRMRNESRAVPVVVLITVLAGAAQALDLTPRSAGVWGWAVASILVLTIGAVVTTAWWLRERPPRWAARAGLALGAAALLAGTAWASGTAVASGLGPLDTPYQPASSSASLQAGWQREIAGWPAQAARAATVPAWRSIETVETSSEVSTDVLATGHEYLPVGGFTGQVPSTPLPLFVEWVRTGRIHTVLVAVRPQTRNPDMRWVLANCQSATGTNARVQVGSRTYDRYACVPSDAA
jgi:hypothetical protein